MELFYILARVYQIVYIEHTQSIMDSEIFSTEAYGGAGKHHYFGTELKVDDAQPKHLYYAAFRTGYAVKMLCYALIILILIHIVVDFFRAIPEVASGLAKLTFKDRFSGKENLQWLGASTDVIRGDYENNTDSLAEQAARQANLVTDMSAPAVPVATAPKSTFLSREKLTTPEEELMKKQRSG